MKKNNKTTKTISKITIILFSVAAILDFINGDYGLTVTFGILAVLDYFYIFKKQ